MDFGGLDWVWELGLNWTGLDWIGVDWDGLGRNRLESMS